jgi:MinD superfamily P-loop ATPase
VNAKAAAIIAASIAVAVACSAHAAADVAEGGKLVAEKNCEGCHASKTLGDAKAIYLRKDRKVTSTAKLKAQVALCNSELNLQLFPDEEEHIVRFLDETYYRFSGK